MLRQLLRFFFPFLICPTCDGKGKKLTTCYSVYDKTGKKRIKWITDGPQVLAVCCRCDHTGVRSLRNFLIEKITPPALLP